MSDLRKSDYEEVYGISLTELNHMTKTQDKEKLLELFFFRTSQAFDNNDIQAAFHAFNCARFIYDRINEEKSGK